MKNQQFKNTLTPRLVAAFGVVAFTGGASAQDLTGTYGSFSEAALQAAALDVFGDQFGGDDAVSQALDYFSFGVDVQAQYNNNIFLTDTEEEEDFIYSVSLPLELSNSKNAENQWSLSYIPKFNFYADNSDQDDADQLVKGGWRREFAKTSVRLGLEWSRTDGANRFSSGSIQSDDFSGDLNIGYQHSGKSRFDFDMGVSTNAFDSNGLNDRQRYNARVSWQYQLTGKIELGPFVGYEHTDTAGTSNPTQDAVSFGVRGSYRAFQKTTFIGYAGAEYRVFDGDNLGDKVSPTFEFGLQHQLTGKTSLTGMLYHNIRPSYSENGQSYSATGVNVSASYRVTNRINARAGVSYEHDNYFGTSSAAVGNFDSDYVTFSIGGTYDTHLGVTIGSGIRYSLNDSETDTRDFDNFIFDVSARYYY